MNRMIVRMVLMSSTAAFLACAGCNPVSAAMSGAKVGVKVFTGAQAKIHVLQGMSAGAIAPYRSVEVGEVSTDVEPICTFAEISEVKLAMREELAEARFRREFPGGEPKLVVNVVLRFFKHGHIYGKEPRLDLLVSFADADTGRQIGRIYVEGISQSPLETKARHLAKANAEAICDLLRERKEGKQ